MASVWNTEIFAESVIHGICCYCYTVHAVWCEYLPVLPVASEKHVSFTCLKNTFAS